MYGNALTAELAPCRLGFSFDFCASHRNAREVEPDGADPTYEHPKKEAIRRSDVDKEQNLIKQKTAEKAWVTTK